MSRIIKQNNIEQSPKLGLAGKIKIGEKNEKGLPTSLNYFIAKSDNPQYELAFEESIGEKPSSITIVFLSDDTNHSCNERYELRDNSGKLVAMGNGEIFNFFLTKQAMFYSDIAQKKGYSDIEQFFAETQKAFGCSKGWKEVLTLRFIIPQIKTLFAEWSFETRGSSSSIAQIVGTFDTIKNIAGTVKNIPFDLNVKKVKSDKAGEKKNYPIVSLIPNISYQNAEKLKGFLAEGNKLGDIGLLTEEKIKLLK